jgi:CheY-like chemotaxis protein
MSNQHSFSILLVDDDQDDQYFFREALNHLDGNLKLSSASSHYEALAFLNVHTPHFIFLDINMPVANGKDCLQYIRSNKKFDEVHVIMLTTSSNEKDINDCYSLGANLYVSKPLSSSDYAAIIKKIFFLYDRNELRYRSRNEFVLDHQRGSAFR